MPDYKPAREVKWRQTPDRELEYWVLWHDYTETPPAKRMVNCRAHDATTRDARRALVAKYQAKEDETKELAVKARLDVAEHGASAFDTPLYDALLLYHAHLVEQKAARLAATKTRVGLSQAAVRQFWDSCKLLRDYLVERGLERTTTGDLDKRHLAGWVNWLAKEPPEPPPPKPGEKPQRKARARGPVTIAKHCRGVRTALRWIADQRPRLMRDAQHVLAGIKAPRQQAPAPEAIDPKVLVKFLRAALAREADTTREVQRKRGEDGKQQKYRQEFKSPDTDVSRLFLVLAALGCRLGEALALRWDDVDPDRGLVVIRSAKTGNVRRVPLADPYQGQVAPELVPVLRAWKLESGGRPWVLPSRSGNAPSFARPTWERLEKKLGVKCNPQRLRRSWVSFACACGLSPAFAALLAGHSSAVAERWYRGVVIERAPGKSMLAAMGLAGLVEGLAAPGTTSTQVPASA